MSVLRAALAAGLAASLAACVDTPLVGDAPVEETDVLCAELGGDRDGDGACDAYDNCLSVGNADQTDGDGDDVGDACEVAADPCAGFAGDRDDDTVCDAFDNCLVDANANQEDADGDGVGDACDAVIDPCAAFAGDRDGDTVCDAFDNCLVDANADQEDADGDGAGDACDVALDPCDAYAGDHDGDGVCDAFDNCVADTNVDQDDADGDGLGDACDPVVGTDACLGLGHDDDGDAICSAYDNCPDVANPGQYDADGDGLGDACDPTPNPCDDAGGDRDGDTVCDPWDNCADVVNRTQVDLDADGIGDLCDPTPPVLPGGDATCAGLGGDVDLDDWCAYIDDCPSVANPTQADGDGDGLGDACDVETCDGVDNDGDGAIDEDLDDGDGDGVSDCFDLCDGEDDTLDADGDQVSDCADPCPGDALNDVDGDGICAASDNCPTVANGGANGQADRDGDGVGNACDVETCDGVSNDADAQVDEDLPDADGDGRCDEIDPCPDDPGDDEDDDGVCYLDDNCPTVANPGGADDDGDGWGDACDLDGACDPAATAAAPGTVPFPSSFELGGVLGTPGSDVVYVSFTDGSASRPNEVAAVHAPTRSILWSVQVGSDPADLALSEDGSLLFVELAGAAQVRAVQVAERRACRSFGLGNGSSASLAVQDLATLPGGDPGTVIISTRNPGFSPDYSGTFVYDHGLRRPVGTAGHTGAREIAVASAGTVYGYNNATTEYGFRELAVDDDGVEQLWVESGLISGFGTDIVFAGGRVYATSGVVVDPVGKVRAGTFTAGGPLAVDPDAGEAYVLTGTTTITVFDTATFLSSGTITLPASFSGTRWVGRWGGSGVVVGDKDSLAFLTVP